MRIVTVRYCSFGVFVIDYFVIFLFILSYFIYMILKFVMK